ncbi:Alpha/Beta hydrolase protein [Polychytrium aggregatum]|uniref:Alpha/Beta hydrolase protein n=1 Tax=Polychytrium aggregatum TaxID=110093 RepID=UPI0022FEA17F|nr:Alpha/Beta hydrolase protein [Polychytrium aggregatum]KAI9206995.1 Alpha/Beta hydrolase protein [Polychytrium aggregatum]
MPRGLLSASLFAAGYGPYYAARTLMNQPHSFPSSWSFAEEITVATLRHVSKDTNASTVRSIIKLSQDRSIAAYNGYGFKSVSIPVYDPEMPHIHSIQGAWIGDPATLPDQNGQFPPDSQCSWDDVIVMMWAHGGGYGVGNVSLFAHVFGKFANDFNHLSKRSNQTLVPRQHLGRQARPKKLVIFSMEYPLAPEYRYPTQIDFARAVYRWLTETVGAKHILVGGESAGGNLTLAFLQKLSAMEHVSVRPFAAVLFSPWVDLSGKFTPEAVQHRLADTSDYLNPAIVHEWADEYTGNAGIKQEIDPLSPLVSPLYMEDYSAVLAPLKGLSVCYGTGELFAPQIEEFLRRCHRSTPPLPYPVHEIVGDDMPHDFPFLFATLPAGPGKKKSKRAFSSTLVWLVEQSLSL